MRSEVAKQVKSIAIREAQNPLVWCPDVASIAASIGYSQIAIYKTLADLQAEGFMEKLHGRRGVYLITTEEGEPQQ